MFGRAMQQDPRGRPPDHAMAHGLRRRTSPQYVLPGGQLVDADWGPKALDPVTLAAAVGATAEAKLLIDSAADFEWVALQVPGQLAAPVLVSIRLVGGPFSGTDLTTQPIDSRLILGNGKRAGFLPSGVWLPKNTTLRITLSNLTATAQTVRLVLDGRDVYTPQDASISEILPARLPYFVGYEYLPLAAGASNVTSSTATHVQRSDGDLELIYHNAIAELAVGGGAAAGALGLQFKDRGQKKRDLVQGQPAPADCIAGDGNEPYYLPTRRLILAGDTFEPKASDLQSPAAPLFVRGVLAGVLHVGGFSEAP